MNKVVYEISDGTKTTSYAEAVEKKEAGYSYVTTFIWEDLPVDKIDEGIPISDKRRVNTLRALPKAGARI